jgi:hypothetical protein
MAKSKVVMNYKLEHTNKELDGRLTSPLLLARFFSSALILLRDRVHLPNSLASHASMIFLQNKALAAPHACTLHVV